jgi:excinuclease ABC subunit C
MEKTLLTKKKLPDSPGVYFFLGPRKKILYIGKATSLRSRVRSYFDPDIAKKRSPLIADMVASAKTIDWRQTDSVLDALILEANLIRQWKPEYNTDGKDDKSWNYVVITNEAIPRVLLVRSRELYQQFEESELKKVFGPFPHGLELREALRLVRKIFPFFDTKKPLDALLSPHDQSKILFNQEIGIYPGKGGLSKEEYKKTIRNITLLFEGKKPMLIRTLEKEMRSAAEDENFEGAAKLRKQIFALTHIRDVSLIKADLNPGPGDFRIEAYDVAHLAGNAMVGVMVVVEDGIAKKSDYRKFNIKETKTSNDTLALREILERRFKHDGWPLPKLLVVDGAKAQMNTAAAVLDSFGYQIPLVGVVKDERHRPREIIGNAEYAKKYEKEILIANAEAHRFAIAFHRDKRRRAVFSV